MSINRWIKKCVAYNGILCLNKKDQVDVMDKSQNHYTDKKLLKQICCIISSKRNIS
jgi:hypothetical protein